MIYLLACTRPMLVMAENAIGHLLASGVRSKDILLCLPDEEAFDAAEQSFSCQILLQEANLPKNEQKCGRGDWGRIVTWKLAVICQQLLVQDVLYLDPDVVVFSDLRKHLPSGDWCACVQSHRDPKPCMGVVAAKSCEFARAFFRAPIGGVASDDAYIGSKWDFNDPRLVLLDTRKFPVGYFPCSPMNSYCHHYNYSVGIESKIMRMKKDGNWLAGDDRCDSR